MSEYTFSGTVTIDGVQHQVTADLTGTPVTPPPVTTPPVTTPPVTTPPTPATSQCYFGIWDEATVNWNTPDGNPVGTWAGAQKFSAAPVKSVSYFNAWLGPFPTVLDQLAGQNNATVYLNLEPWNTWGNGPTPTMSDIAKGVYDSSLTAIGNAIKVGGNDVWVTFAHEMNGTWYPWGIQAVSPAQWQAGYKHVADVIRAAAGGHAKMVWCPSNNDVGPVTPYWVGDSYADIVAADMYLNQYAVAAGKTYNTFNKPTADEIRTLTSKPIWNAETGVSGTGREQAITQFVSDMHADGLSGFTWWNQDSFALTTSEIAALCAAVNAWNAS